MADSTPSYLDQLYSYAPPSALPQVAHSQYLARALEAIRQSAANGIRTPTALWSNLAAEALDKSSQNRSNKQLSDAINSGFANYASALSGGGAPAGYGSPDGGGGGFDPRMASLAYTAQAPIPGVTPSGGPPPNATPPPGIGATAPPGGGPSPGPMPGVGSPGPTPQPPSPQPQTDPNAAQKAPMQYVNPVLRQRLMEIVGNPGIPLAFKQQALAKLQELNIQAQTPVDPNKDYAIDAQGNIQPLHPQTIVSENPFGVTTRDPAGNFKTTDLPNKTLDIAGFQKALREPTTPIGMYYNSLQKYGSVMNDTGKPNSATDTRLIEAAQEIMNANPQLAVREGFFKTIEGAQGGMSQFIAGIRNSLDPASGLLNDGMRQKLKDVLGQGVQERYRAAIDYQKAIAPILKSGAGVDLPDIDAPDSIKQTLPGVGAPTAAPNGDTGVKHGVEPASAPPGLKTQLGQTKLAFGGRPLSPAEAANLPPSTSFVTIDGRTLVHH